MVFGGQFLSFGMFLRLMISMDQNFIPFYDGIIFHGVGVWILCLSTHQLTDAALDCHERCCCELSGTSCVRPYVFSSLGHRPRSGAAESLGFTVLFLRMFDIMGIFQPFLARKPYFQKASRKTLEKSDLAPPPHFGEPAAQTDSATCRDHTGSETGGHHRKPEEIFEWEGAS